MTGEQHCASCTTCITACHTSTLLIKMPNWFPRPRIQDLAASQRRVAQLVQQLGQSNPAGATQDGAVLINVGSPSRTFLHRR